MSSSPMRPSLWGQLLARLQGEVPADTLEAYRRAGGGVYAALDEVEQRRLAAKIEGLDQWSLPLATQTGMLCSWNAFLLQTLGDQFLDADYRANPASVGFVPPVTAEQVLAFYSQVEGWLTRANQAGSNPAYLLDVTVPAELPPWSSVEPCPPAHLEATLEAARAAQVHTDAAMPTFQEKGLPAERLADLQRLRQILADAHSKHDYADRLWAAKPPQTLHEQIEQHARAAVELYYLAGQIMAMPSLAREARVSQASTHAGTAPKPLALPGHPGFDQWALTDPRTRADWKRDPAARRAIQALWANDPDPRRTVALQNEVNAALTRGDVEYATTSSGQPLGHYYCCPWAAVYVAKRSLTIGGQRLRALQQFTLDVSAEAVPSGGDFERSVLLGVFNPTDRVDYCEPGAEDHAD